MNKNDFKPIEDFFAKSENFLFRSVENVNHTPHPYTIGGRHDTVCFLSLKKNVTEDEAQAELKDIDALMKENGVAGFSFVETTEKFRITQPAEQA